MNKVIVKFNSKQIGTENNTIKTKSLGNHHVKNGISYIIYKEKILNDTQETSSMIKLTENALVLTRNGSVKQQQVFAEGKTSTSDYITPYGKLKMTVETHCFEIINNANSRIIKIDYALYLNDSWQSNNELTIHILPAD